MNEYQHLHSPVPRERMNVSEHNIKVLIEKVEALILEVRTLEHRLSVVERAVPWKRPRPK